MKGLRKIRTLIFVFIAFLITGTVFAQDIVYLKPVSGTDAYEYASPSDSVYKAADNLFANNAEIKLAAANYKRVQLEKKLKFKKQLESSGMSSSDVSLMMTNYKIKPTYFILSETEGGNACLLGDLKILEKGPSGNVVQTKYVNTPAIHLSMNGRTMKSNDIADITRSCCHEISHGAMGIAYGGLDNFPKSNFLGEPHWRSMVSDEGLAFIEGWAEANGPYFSKKSKYNKSLQENRYAFNEDGTLKNDTEMRCTEGVVASIMYSVINGSAGIEDGYTKIMNLFSQARPNGFSDFEKAYSKMYPEDAEKMFDLVTASTFGANISPLAGDMYAKLLYGEITADQYSAWISKEKVSTWPDYYKNLTIDIDLSTGNQLTGFSKSRVTIAADAFYVPVQDVETNVQQSDAAYVEDNSNPFSEYVKLVKQGKKNTPEGKKALKEALDRAREQERSAQNPEDPEYFPAVADPKDDNTLGEAAIDRGQRFEQKDRGIRYDQKDRGIRYDQKDRGIRYDQKDRGIRYDQKDRGVRYGQDDNSTEYDQIDRGSKLGQ